MSRIQKSRKNNVSGKSDNPSAKPEMTTENERTYVKPEVKEERDISEISMFDENSDDRPLTEFNGVQVPVSGNQGSENSIIMCSNLDTSISSGGFKSTEERRSELKPKGMRDRKLFNSKKVNNALLENKSRKVKEKDKENYEDRLDRKIRELELKVRLEELRTTRAQLALNQKERELEEMKNKIVFTITSPSDYTRGKIQEFMQGPTMKSFYNPALHGGVPLTFDQYENMLNMMHFPLDMASTACTNNFRSVYLSGNVPNTIKIFYPHCSYSERIEKDDNNSPEFSIITLSNRFNGQTSYYEDAKYDGRKYQVGGERSALTSTRKHMDNFPVLRTIPFKNSEIEDVDNMLEVLRQYKNRFYFADAMQQFRFRHSIDEIAYIYLESDCVPKASAFTLDKLLKWLNPEGLMKNRQLFYTNEELAADPSLVNNIPISSPVDTTVKVTDVVAIPPNGVNKDQQNTGELESGPVITLNSVVPKDYDTTRRWFRGAVKSLIDAGRLPTQYKENPMRKKR